MHIESIDLQDFRGFKGEVRLPIHPDLCVLVGLNGAGKSAVLDAAGSLLSVAVSWIAGVSQAWYAAGDEANIHTGADWSFWQCTAAWPGVGEPRGLALSAGEIPKSIDSEATSLGFLDILRDGVPDLSVVLPFMASVHSGSTRVPVSHARRGLKLEGRLAAYAGAFDSESVQFKALEGWFESEENLENEKKIKQGRLNIELPSLRAVRTAVHLFMETLRGTSLGHLSVVRTHKNGPLAPARGRLVIKKGEQDLFLYQLSDGERRLVLLVADAARRMVILNPGLEDALQTPGVLLIDEIELHLHPQWQRTVIPAIRAAFPKLQLIVATHAPAVLSTVPNECILVLDDGNVLEGVPRAFGLDSNTILSGLMGTSVLPEPIQAAVDQLYGLIDKSPRKARARLKLLETELGPDHPELVRARALMTFVSG